MPILELHDVSKSFDGFQAVADASFDLVPGELHALLGENGAGKSSLMNIVAGLYRPDKGRIRVKGEDVHIDGPSIAKKLGIGMVHQHYKLVKAFNAVENILLAAGADKYRTGLAEVEKSVCEHCEEMGFAVDLKRPVGALSVAEQQRVEILKVLVNGAEIIILDEPSAVLTDSEAAALLKVMRTLAAKGAAVVLITHKLGEVKAFADRVTIMRGGRTVTTADPKGSSLADLTAKIIGQAVCETRHPAKAIGAPVLHLKAITGARADGHRTLHGVDLTLRAGELYGIAGVGGNGQPELAEILMGVNRPTGGTLEFVGAGDISRSNPAERRKLGLVCIPADRATYGLAGELSICENYIVTGVRSGRFGSWTRVNWRSGAASTKDAVSAFEVLGVRSTRQKASLLSGGNAQKLVIARELASPPRIVVAHSPSRGLDARATSEVRRRLLEARDAGAAVLLISEDLDEIMLMSDRIGVMTRGRIVQEFEAPADRQLLGKAMVHHD